ncbi:hypothetical protein BCF44_103626 [Kutzneria buriramensis]|uniref:Membrane protein YqaA with SNARE-associated domain n=1 Tax=Kutzneria buriramensis TaxID=1045776 RepID=A0A3E0I1W8_9PSEU|nr:hypothetical protein BCF44_103626 [Kutzneria buriramensis]
MLLWLLLSLGVAVGSALCPLISVELFLVGMIANGHHPPIACWILGGVVAVGQVVGKLLYFFAARGRITLPTWLQPKDKPRRQTWWTTAWAKVGVWFGALRAQCEKRPKLMIATTGVSSVVGMPPFMATTVLAGVARMSVLVFVGVTLAGRFIRFTALAASPHLLSHVLPHFA